MRVVLLLGLLLPGCFYSDPINTAPQADIQQVGAEVYKLDTVTFQSNSSRDPDGDTLAFTWTANACTEDGICDIFLGDSIYPSFTVGPLTSKAPFEVILTVTDPQGATATDHLSVPVGNREPTVTAETITPTDDLGGFVVGRTIDVVASASDPDDDPITITAELAAPKGSAPGGPALTEIEPGRWRLTPDAAGIWMVTVNVVDDDEPAGTASTILPISISPDRDPCLTATRPAPTTSAAPLIVLTSDGARSLDVVGVVDDLDPYPSDQGATDPLLGRPSFRWLVGAPGAPPTLLDGSDVAAYLFDPAAYSLGDDVVVRVEVADRRGEWPSCDSLLDTCGEPACSQRQTWHVRVR